MTYRQLQTALAHLRELEANLHTADELDRLAKWPIQTREEREREAAHYRKIVDMELDKEIELSE